MFFLVKYFTKNSKHQYNLWGLPVRLSIESSFSLWFLPWLCHTYWTVITPSQWYRCDLWYREGTVDDCRCRENGRAARGRCSTCDLLLDVWFGTSAATTRALSFESTVAGTYRLSLDSETLFPRVTSQDSWWQQLKEAIERRTNGAVHQHWQRYRCIKQASPLLDSSKNVTLLLMTTINVIMVQQAKGCGCI